MRLKRSIALTLSLIMVLFLSVCYVSADDFGDTKGHWAEKEIATWTSHGVIQGHGGLFQPEQKITRAEIAVIMDRLMGFQVKAENNFSDLSSTWYTAAILKNVANDILKGNNGTIRPNDEISRQEFAIVMCRAFNIAPLTGNTEFVDDEAIESWAKPYVKALSSKGYIKGLENHKFGPKKPISRAAVVKLIDNIVAELYSKEGAYSKNISGNLVINTAGVEVNNTTIDGDLILAEGIGNGDVRLNNVKVKGRVMARGGGKNSIYFNNVDVNGALVINKKGGEIRIVSEGATKLSVVTLESGAIIVARNLNGGSIETIEIPASLAKDQKVVLDGSFKKVENKAEGAKLQISGSVDSLLLKEKSEVTGNAEIKIVETAKGAESQVNGTIIKEGQKKELFSANSNNANNQANNNNGSSNSDSTSSGGSGGSSSGDAGNTGGGSGGDSGGGTGGGSSSGEGSGGSGDSGTDPEPVTTYTVTFDSNGGDEIPPIKDVKKGSKISNDRIPKKVEEGYSLDFLGWYKEKALETEWNFDNDTVNDNITLYAKWSGVQAPTGSDNRFADGYPKMKINSSGKLEIALKLKNEPEAEKPAEVFVVADNYNHIWGKNRTTSAAVMAGYFGDKSMKYNAREYPYLKITDANEHLIKTNISLNSVRGVGAAIVLKIGETTTENPIYLEYAGSPASDLDERAPEKTLAFINKDRNKIYLGYDEGLVSTDIPGKEEFKLSTGKIKNVSINKFENTLWFDGVVELELDSAPESIDNLTLRYTPQSNGSIRDQAGNKASGFENFKVLDATSKITNILVSNDMKYISFNVEQGIRGTYNLYYSYGKEVGEYKEIEYPDAHRSTSLHSSDSDFKILEHFLVKLKDVPNQVENGKFFLKIDGDIKTYADENIEAITGEARPQTESEEISAVSCTYNPEVGIVITFDEQTKINNSAFAEHFIVTIEEKEYRLRGDAMTMGNTITLKPTTFKHLEDKTLVGAKIKFQPVYNDDEFKITFPTGKPIPKFDNVTIRNKD